MIMEYNVLYIIYSTVSLSSTISMCYICVFSTKTQHWIAFRFSESDHKGGNVKIVNCLVFSYSEGVVYKDPSN